MIFVGDVHGKIRQFEQLVNSYSPEEKIVQIGDMAAGFVFIPRFSNNVTWFRGNHDDPAISRNHYNYRKDYGYDPEQKLFHMAGAWSIDWAWRKAQMAYGGHAIWWEDEELSQEQLDKAYDLYVKSKPEIVATHEAPASIVPEILNASAGKKTIQPGDPTYDPNHPSQKKDAILITEKTFRPEKLECIYTRTSATLQKMFEAHQPKRWLFGHYHIDKSVESNGTYFRCLNELSTFEVKLSNEKN